MSLMPLWIPLFLGITLGLFIALLGATLFFATKHKQLSAILGVVGLMVVVGALALFWVSIRM